MSKLRAQIRRVEREKAKAEGKEDKKIIEACRRIGLPEQSMLEIQHRMNEFQDVMITRASRAACELAYDGEKYISIANILIMLYAMKMTVGELKTVQRSYQKILDNYNAAAEYVDRIGIRKAYEDFRQDYGIHLAFDDFDVNTMSDIKVGEDAIRMRIQDYERAL